MELVTGLKKGKEVVRGVEEGGQWLGRGSVRKRENVRRRGSVRKREKVSRRGSFKSTQIGGLRNEPCTICGAQKRKKGCEGSWASMVERTRSRKSSSSYRQPGA